MNKREKQVIPYAELLEKLQGLLASYPVECRNIHIDAVTVYPEQHDGANWYVNYYQRSGDDNDLPACKEKILPEIRILRESYDVAE